MAEAATHGGVSEPSQAADAPVGHLSAPKADEQAPDSSATAPQALSAAAPTQQNGKVQETVAARVAPLQGQPPANGNLGSAALVQALAAAASTSEVHRILEAQGREGLLALRDGRSQHYNFVFSLAKFETGDNEQYKRNLAEACRLLVTKYGLSLAPDSQNQQTALFFACRFGNDELVQAMLDLRVEVDHLDRNQQTALYYAARDNRAECARRLLVARADPNIRDKMGQAPLFFAAKNSAEHSLDVLIDGRADPQQIDQNEQTALHYAARFNAVGTTQRLLRARADPCSRDRNGETPVMFAAFGRPRPDNTGMGSPECLTEMLKHAGPTAAGIVDQHGRTALFVSFNVKCFEALLTHGCSADVRDHLGAPVLFYEAKSALPASRDKVLCLLEHKASLDLRDGSGKTVLHHAALSTQSASCEELLKHIPSQIVNAVDKRGRTPIFDAKLPQCVEALLRHSCNPNVLDKDGRTALFSAAKEGRNEKIQLLLRHKADADIRDRMWQTPLAVAQQAKQHTSVAILQEHLASLRPPEAKGRVAAASSGRSRAKAQAKTSTTPAKEAKVLPARRNRGVLPERIVANSMAAAGLPEQPQYQQQVPKRVGPNSAEQTPKRQRRGHSVSSAGSSVAATPLRRGARRRKTQTPDRNASRRRRRYCLVHDDAEQGSREHQVLLEKLLRDLPWLRGSTQAVGDDQE